MCGKAPLFRWSILEYGGYAAVVEPPRERQRRRSREKQVSESAGKAELFRTSTGKPEEGLDKSCVFPCL
jgi:hypothetical protein